MSGWAAAANFAGGIGSSALSLLASKRAIKFQKEAMKNRHQWEVEDLRKAGLNPILSANNGASTGGLNMPMPDTSGISKGVNSAIAALQVENQLKQQEANIALTKQQTYAARAAGDAAYSNARLLNENAANAQRLNDYMRSNPDVYDAIQKNAVNSIGGLSAIGEDILHGMYNSSKQFASRVFEGARKNLRSPK